MRDFNTGESKWNGYANGLLCYFSYVSREFDFCSADGHFNSLHVFVTFGNYNNPETFVPVMNTPV